MSTAAPIICSVDEAAQAIGVDASLIAVSLITGAIKADMHGAGNRALFHRSSLDRIKAHFSTSATVTRPGVTTKALTQTPCPTKTPTTN